MCEPITIAMIASMALSGVNAAAQHKNAKVQARAIDKQSAVQEEEISKAAGAEMTERARAARRERAAMRAAGSSSGINLDTSGSFLAQLQASVMNQYNDQGLVTYNEKAQQRARVAQTRTAKAGLQMPSPLASALQIGASGASTYAGFKATETKASKAASGK